MDQQFVANFEQTLIQATQGESVKAATTKLSNEFYKNPASLPASIHILQNNTNEQIRLLAAVEARKLVNKFWETADVQTKNHIKETILTSAFTDASKTVRHQIARVISSITMYDLSQWTSLLPLLSSAVTDDSNVQGKETAAYVLLTIVETQNEEFGANVDSFFALFQKTILDQSSLPVRIYSVQALGNIASVAEELVDEHPQLAQSFKSSVPAMVNVLKEVIAAGDEVNAKLVFNTFNDLLLLNAKLIGDNLIHLIQLMIEISVNTQVDEDIRNFSITFLSTAIMYRKNKISSKKLGRDITLAALKIACEEVDVEAELDNEDDDNENEESDPASLALRLIAIASSELPASQVVNTIFEQLPALLSSANQFERRGALSAIGIAVRGAPDYFTTYLTKIVQAISVGLKDSELIVRVAALKALAQLIQELQDLLSEHYEELLPSIIAIIDSATKYTVYKYACISLDALIEFMSMDAVTKYLEPLMNKLFEMLGNTENSKLRAIIVSAIGSTAFAAGSSFIPYFAKSIELLEPFIQNAGHIEGMSEDDIELRALTFENISTMARAVRSDSFSKVAQPLIEASYISITSENGRLREAGYAFIYNMAKVYGKDFAPFLEKIIPEIFKTLAQEEFNLNFGEDDDAEDFADLDEEELNEKLQFHTGITIEKESAAIALGELATGTKELFAPYIAQSVTVLSEQAEESYDMRETALAALWKIVESFIALQVEKTKYPKGVPSGSYVNDDVLNLIKHTRKLSLDALPTEVEMSMTTTVLDNFSELMKKYGPIIITDNGNTEELEILCVELMKLLKSEHPAQNFDNEELPEDEEEVDASETDSMLYDSALEVLVSLSFALGPDFNKIFASFKDVIAAGVKSQSKNKKSASIGALADIAAGIKESNPYSQELLQMFVEKLQNDKSVEVKSNAAYGIGIVIFYSNENFSSIYADIFNALSKLLSKVQKQAATVDEDDEEARDVINRSYANASGCVARLILKAPESTPLNVVMPILLDHLPLETGFEENAPIFELIAKLYQTSIEQIAPFTARIVEVFAHVFLKDQERERLERDSTLGREENIDRLKQFETPELKQQVIELLKFIESQHAGSVSSNEILSKVIA